MNRIELHTRTGALPAEVSTHVTTVEIPSFKTLPDVIVWGTRTFIRDPFESEQDPRHTLKYIEGFCYSVPIVR